MNEYLKRVPFFLLTIPAFFLLYNNNYYFGLLEWHRIGVDLLLYFFAPFVLLGLFKFTFRSWIKAGVFLSVLMIIFYFFQPLHNLLKSLPVLFFIASYKILIPLLLIIFTAFAFYLAKSRKSYTTFFSYINIVFAVLVLYETAIAFNHLRTGKTAQHDLADKQKKLLNSFKRCDTCLNPDIYYFIFDEYTSNKYLSAEFNYQNTQLNDFLKEKGFFIAADSRSNYNFTHMSIASELNMNYLSAVRDQSGYYARDLLKANYTIYKNELCMMLRRQGYELKNYSIFDIEDAPAFSSRPYRDQYLAFILDQTLIRKIRKDIGWNFMKPDSSAPLSAKVKQEQEDDVRRIAESKQGVLQTINARNRQPTFTYAHFLMPHPPFYFDSSGNRLPELYSLYHLEREDYIQQLAYVNKFLIMPLIDSIFKVSKRPFVIILQGDHGYRNYEPGKEDLEFYNLNAVYFPDRDYKTMHPAFTSVNTFRFVLNKYFNTSLPLIKDSSFYLKRNPE